MFSSSRPPLITTCCMHAPSRKKDGLNILRGGILKSSFPQGALHIRACCLDINISPKPPTSSSVMGFAPLHPWMKILTGWLYMDISLNNVIQRKTTWALQTRVRNQIKFMFSHFLKTLLAVICKNYKKLAKLRKVDFFNFLRKKEKIVSNMWNGGTFFVKIFRWHEILADVRENICFCENIFVFPKVFAKICVWQEQLRDFREKDILRNFVSFGENEKRHFSPFLKSYEMLKKRSQSVIII